MHLLSVHQTLFPTIVRRAWLLVFLVALSHPAAAAEPTYLTSSALLKRALDALQLETGLSPQVALIDIAADRIIVRTQGKAAAHHTDEWTISRFKLLWMDRDTVRGPKPVQDGGIVAEAEGSFFPMSDLGFDAFEGVIADAVERAGLEETPRIEGITIDRATHILPERRYGNVRWSIRLTTGRESVTVFANAAGAITHADLSGTFRAQRLDLLTQDDWPMNEAQDELAAVIGPDEVVHGLTVYGSYLFLEVDHPDKPKTKTSYSWNYSGVRKGLVDSKMIPTENMFGFVQQTVRFSLEEVDLTVLPQVKAATHAAYGGKDASISFIVAQKSVLKPGTPEVTWQVRMKDGNGESGRVEVSMTGDVLHVELPESRRPPEDYLAPQSLTRLLDRLEQEFGSAAVFTEIMVTSDKASILVEDPQANGKNARFVTSSSGTMRFGEPMPFKANVDKTMAFTLGELGAHLRGSVAEWNAKTVSEMNLDDAAVYRWTIARRMTPKTGDPVLSVEVRAGIDDGWTGGWVVFASDGTVHEVMRP